MPVGMAWPTRSNTAIGTLQLRFYKTHLILWYEKSKKSFNQFATLESPKYLSSPNFGFDFFVKHVFF